MKVLLEGYGALASFTGEISGWVFVSGKTEVAEEDAEAAVRLLTRYHAVRLVDHADRRGPERGRRGYDVAPPPPPEVVVKEVVPEPMPEEPDLPPPAPPVILRSLEDELLDLPLAKLEALAEGCDQTFLDRLAMREQELGARPEILRLLGVRT